MKKFLLSTKHTNTIDLALLVLRLGAGFLMIPNHGWKKLVNFSEISENFVSFLGMSGSLSLALAIFAELICSLLIMAGLLTRLACIPLFVCMLMIFNVHEWNFLGKQEYASLLFICYITIFLAGPGKFSLDKVLLKK